MTQRSTPPFRADHVGSLLRPPQLRAAREAWRRGERSAAALAAEEDAAIRSAVALQESVGLSAVTDGEFRRDYWHLDFMTGFDGVTQTEPMRVPFSDGVDFVAPRAVVSGKVGYPAGGVMRAHFAFLKDATARTAKFTAPAPTMFHQGIVGKLYDTGTYPEVEGLWRDLGRAYNDWMRDFAALGATYLQLDDVNTAVLCDDTRRAALGAAGEDPDQVLGRYIRVINEAVAGRPADLTVTVHLCRGNFQSKYMTAGGYDAVAERYLAETEVDGFFMEYDDERSGDFAPLRFLPKGKFAVLGIVSSKFAALESIDDLKRRIDEAARHVPLEQLCLSPQCGFASTHHGNLLGADDQRRKLERIVELADDVWGAAG